MAIRNLRRQATVPGGYQGTANAAPIFVDSDTNQVRIVPNGSNTTVEKVVSLGPVTSIQLVPTSITVLSPDDQEKVFIQTLASGTQTYTLPLATTALNMQITFKCENAGSEILINPNAADQISIKGLIDHSTSVKPAAGTGVKNTAATNVIGDYLTLVCDGVATWYEVGGAGIWASQ